MRTVPVALLLAAGLLSVPASAQTHQCGDIQLVFVNPDLQPKPDGFIHAQGQFFAQFQAIGPDADKIEVFGFSFGPDTADFDEGACATPVWATGTYIYNYRADRDPSDGFFIPIKTPLVPDGTYAAAVHAYDANNMELARFWGRAIIDNCDPQSTPLQERCDGTEQLVAHDRTAPWPIVLPGDGQPLEGHKFTIEFGEALANVTVLLNGEDITSQLVPWDGRQWDADLVPDYGPAGLGSVLTPPCTQQYHTCETYGPAYEWTGRDLTAADVVRVDAYDVAGNRAVKDVHIGSGIGGGAVTQAEPIIETTADEVQKTATSGAAIFRFTVRNSGGGEGHPFAEATVPAGWTAEWSPTHVVVPAGQVREQELSVRPPSGTAPGTYPVNATFRYASGGVQRELSHPLRVVVEGASTATTSATTTDDAESPLPLPLALAALGAALAMRQRRQPGRRSEPS